MMEKKLGNVKVKSMNGALDDIPNDCGYGGLNRQTSMIPCVITGRNRTVT